MHLQVICIIKLLTASNTMFLNILLKKSSAIVGLMNQIIDCDNFLMRSTLSDWAGRFRL